MLNKVLNNTQVIKKQQKRGGKEQRANIKYRKSVARGRFRSAILSGLVNDTNSLIRRQKSMS